MDFSCFDMASFCFLRLIRLTPLHEACLCCELGGRVFGLPVVLRPWTQPFYQNGWGGGRQANTLEPTDDARGC